MTVAERLERIEELLSRPAGGWSLIPLANQAEAAWLEVRSLRLAVEAARNGTRAEGGKAAA